MHSHLILSAFINGLFCGALCFQAAQRRGANTFLWAAIGLLLGLPGLILCLLVLRRAKKERRLPSPFPQISPWENDHWYYLTESKEQRGPFNLRGLITCARQGELTPRSYVWCSDLEGWSRIEDLDGLGKEVFQERARPAIGRA